MSEEIVNQNNLDTQLDLVVSDIINSSNGDDTENLFALFRQLQSKKALIRSATYSKLLDKISEQMNIRFDKRSDEFSNHDLLKYFEAVEKAVDKSENTEIPAIQINQQNNITVNHELSAQSRSNVLKAINDILKGNTLDDISPEATE